MFLIENMEYVLCVSATISVCVSPGRGILDCLKMLQGGLRFWQVCDTIGFCHGVGGLFQ